ncbi:MAG: hypothetical protein H0W78_13375 [Planctomycetes bacterium]|nr:hypothetical protein [Planctomycetota bacterium]
MRSSAIAFVALITFAILSVGCWLETGRGPGDKAHGQEPVGTTPAPPETNSVPGADSVKPTPAPSATTPVPDAHPAETTPVK